jgi:DNA-binding Lrp family transcriptional regulator
MESVRLPRFTRAKQITPPQLTARDREIIQRVFAHRFLRSGHIHAFIGGSRQQLLRRLQRLYHHGYLERPRAQIDYYHQGGSRSMVYGLGHTGAALLKRELNLPFHRLDWSAKNQEVKRLFLEHALMTADIMVAFELACRRHDGVRLISADELSLPAETRKVREPFRWHVTVRQQSHLGAQPDRVFALEFPDRTRAYFFLEADRATMPVMRQDFEKSSFYRKLIAYEATWKQNIHCSRFGFNRFRVLTVTTSVERVNHLIDACRQLERGQGLFLFTDLASLLAHDNILTLPWQSCQAGKIEALT